MIKLRRTNSEDQDFIELVAALDGELAERDGEEHDFYHQFNAIDDIKYAVVAYRDSKPVGCGAIKAFDKDSVEVKRMYTLPTYRGMGIASRILADLEDWAAELGYSSCVLETGLQQPEAIALYRKQGYQDIANYGQYIGVANSRCFRKTIKLN